MLTAFVVTLLAGLATALGGALAMVPRLRGRHKQALPLALAGGAMIAVSVGEMLPHAWRELAGPDQLVQMAGSILFGAGLAVVLGAVVPRLQRRFRAQLGTGTDAAMARTAVVAAAVVIAHNLPEGMATFEATIYDPQFGIGLAAAIAVHNIPEGMAVAAPLYLATGRWRPAVLWATAAGLAEPVGGLLGHLLLGTTPLATGGILAALAAMMLAISVGELLPTAWRLGGWRRALAGSLAGALVMAGTLVVL